MKFIEIKDTKNEVHYINPSKIVRIYPTLTEVRIVLIDGYIVYTNMSLTTMLEFIEE